MEAAPASRRLDGKRALVTGAATGIGRATAKRLAADGAVVAVNYLGHPERAEQLVEEIAAAGGRATALEADVSREDPVERMFVEAASDLLGHVDLLVNNAGVQAEFALEELTLAEWERVIGVNLTGPFLCSREFARALPRGAPGVIVNVSSVHELMPWVRYSHYCASKGGLKLFAQTIAKELAPRGVRVASVAPGAIATPINPELDNERARREAGRDIPWGRVGEPEEIADAIAWLASDEARYVTGETIFVDGGLSLHPGVD